MSGQCVSSHTWSLLSSPAAGSLKAVPFGSTTEAKGNHQREMWFCWFGRESEAKSCFSIMRTSEVKRLPFKERPTRTNQSKLCFRKLCFSKVAVFNHSCLNENCSLRRYRFSHLFYKLWVRRVGVGGGVKLFAAREAVVCKTDPCQFCQKKSSFHSK